MPADMEKLLKDKDIILTTIQTKGPSLPIHAARAGNLSTIFASAYLSELYAEKKVKISNLKIGSSPLYYLEGQEAQLENFIEHLNGKEKEAFSLLKREKILEDQKQDPAIRVALRAIRDFAVQFNVTLGLDKKLFWKYHLTPDDEAKILIQEIIEPKKKPVQKEKKAKKVQEKEETISSTETLVTKEEKISKKKVPQESKFTKSMKDYLTAKNMELLEIKEEGKKDFLAKIRIDTLFGKQEYLLVAKDKKKLREEDLIHALHKAQNEKMPALLMAPGDIDKKALDFIKDYKNLVKFEKVKF